MFKDRKETNISPEKGQKQAQAHSGPAAVAAQRQDAPVAMSDDDIKSETAALTQKQQSMVTKEHILNHFSKRTFKHAFAWKCHCCLSVTTH
jgi:hypothetical protein